MSTKQQNKRVARKNALRVKDSEFEMKATRDSMYAARRCYGRGVGK